MLFPEVAARQTVPARDSRDYNDSGHIGESARRNTRYHPFADSNVTIIDIDQDGTENLPESLQPDTQSSRSFAKHNDSFTTQSIFQQLVPTGLTLPRESQAARAYLRRQSDSAIMHFLRVDDTRVDMIL